MNSQLDPVGDLFNNTEIPSTLLDQAPTSILDAPKKSRPLRLPPSGFWEHEITSDQIGYTHPIFLQCYFPLHHSAENSQRWQSNNGLSSLVIRAGELIYPDRPNEFRRCEVPAGSKARILNAYITGYALLHKTREIPMGKTLHKGMQKLGISIGGRNSVELQREIQNLACSIIYLGTWGKIKRQQQATVADEISFWSERDSNQKLSWSSSFWLSEKYYQALKEGDMLPPIHWPSILSLQHNPRAMDIHTFLVHRLNSLKNPVKVSADALHSMFGSEIKQRKHFWSKFLPALHLAHKWYPKANITILEDRSGILLRPSSLLIPSRSSARLSI